MKKSVIIVKWLYFEKSFSGMDNSSNCGKSSAHLLDRVEWYYVK